MSRNAPQLPNNSLTQEAITALTSTGFSQGDLVFYKGSTNSYVAPSDLTPPTSVPFSYAPTSPILGGGIGGTVSSVFGSTFTANKGASKNRFADVLTNGNIVQVYNKSAIPCFRIVDTSGAVVVSEVQITATFTMGGDDIGVVALTGGGFAAYWLNNTGGTANCANYAIYSNTGSLVTAATNESSGPVNTTSNAAFNGVALSGGGFALCFMNTAKLMYYRGYSATGVPAYVWTSFAMTANSALTYFPMTARNDNTFVILAYTTSYQYRIVNASGGVTNSGGITAAAYFTTLDATTLSDGQTVVFAYQNTVSSVFQASIRILPSSNVIGSEIQPFPSANVEVDTSGAARARYYVLLGLSTGNFIFMYSDIYGQAQYAFFNSSGVAISGTNANGTLPKRLDGVVGIVNSRVTPLEFGGKVNFYWRNVAYSTAALNMMTASVNVTTYAPVYSISTTQQLTTSNGTTGSIYTAGVTPTKAQYYAATTETLPVSLSVGYTVSPTAITNTACDCSSSATLPDGRLLFAYRTTAYEIKVAVYSITGQYQQTIDIGTGVATSTGSFVSMRICALPSGKFVVAYFSSTTSIRTAVYSSSFTLINNSVAATPTTLTNASGVSLTALTTDKFAIGYVDGASSYAYYMVRDSANSLVASGNLNSSTATNVGISADNSGGFIVAFHDNGSTTHRAFSVYEYGVALYTTYANVSVGGNPDIPGYNFASLPGGGFIMPVPSSTTSLNFYPYGFDMTTYAQYSVATTIQNDFNYAMGLTGSGTTVFANLTASTATIATIWPGVTVANNGAIATTKPSSNTFTLTSYNGRSATTGPSITPSYGGNVALLWMNASSYPTFAIINVMPDATTLALTSGVSVSNNVAIVPYTSPSSNAITNSVLKGVAATTASAGSFGVIQTNGAAILNSNYSSSTAPQAFDYESPNGTGVSGAKGTITGRNITMQGNNQ